MQLQPSTVAALQAFPFRWTAPSELDDWADWAVWSSIDLVLDYAQSSRGIEAVTDLECDFLLASSKVMLELENASMIDSASERALIMCTHIFCNGLINAESANYNHYLSEYFKLLEPFQPQRGLDCPVGVRLTYWLEDRIEQNAVFFSGSTMHLLGLGSMFNHSCLPNVEYRYKAALHLYDFYLMRPATRGDALCISYIPFPIDDRKARAARLSFDCTCACCKDEDGHGPLPSAYAAAHGLKASGKHCWQCGAESQKHCQRCCVAIYCSLECQRTNWQLVHRGICSTLLKGTKAVS